jgi:Ferritin-like domain
MLAELREDNRALTARLREAHDVCQEHRDIATASFIEIWTTKRGGACGSFSKYPAPGSGSMRTLLMMLLLFGTCF